MSAIPQFISFDGVDGAGKSTQIERFCEYLASVGREVVRCRDPGTTGVGERLRSIVLDHGDDPLGMRTEMLVYMAARSQLVDEVIRPALKDGKMVVSDRFLLSNVAYQGYGGGLPIEEVWAVGRIATHRVLPDLTIVLDLDPTTAASRRTGGDDRIESRGASFFEAVREGFLAEARRDSEHIAVVNASGQVDHVHADVVAAFEARQQQQP